MTDGTSDGGETIVKIEEIKALTGNTPTAIGSMYGWNQKGGVMASSTGNMTGIYDLSGGTWERTASYIANGHDNLSKYGKSVTEEEGILKKSSTKYTMVYPYDTAIDTNTENKDMLRQANYAKNIKIYGDAIRETSILGTGTNSWETDFSYYCSSNDVFLIKGGFFWDSNYSGIFYFHCKGGMSDYGAGFRAVVISK